MGGKLYSLSMSDPSLAEAIAVLLGIATVVTGFFIILIKQAYLAGVYASPITPYGSIKGYVSGFNRPIPMPSEMEIRRVAAKAFMDNLMGVKLQIWLISITSLFVTAYPLVSRLRNSIIPAASISGASPVGMVWTGLIPVVLASLGFSLVLIGMGVTAYKAYFGIRLTRGFILVLTDLVLYIIGVSILFYVLYIMTGRPEAGILFGFLGALGIDRIPISITGLLAFGVAVNLTGITLLALASHRRWLAI